jgi:hypothetical protein
LGIAVTFINRLPVDDVTGRAVVSDTAPSAGDAYLAGIRFSATDNTLYILTGAVPGTASFQDGFARDATTGRLCALIDNPPSAPNRYYNDGILGDADGHMCMTTANVIAGYVHGWPVDSIGQICIVGETPPVTATFDTVIVGVGGGEDAIQAFIAQMYFGNGGFASGFYSSQAAFLAAHPGLTLQDFTGIAPAAGSAVHSSFTGFTSSASPDTTSVYDTAGLTPTSVYCCVGATGAAFQTLTFTFSPPVNSVGFFYASSFFAPALGGTITFKNGGTTLHSEVVSGPPAIDVFTAFAGYSTAGDAP